MNFNTFGKMKLKITIIIATTIFFASISGCTVFNKIDFADRQQNKRLDREHWQYLADRGFPEGFIELGNMAESSADEFHLALAYYQRAYDLGHEPAAYYLGRYYYRHHQNSEELERAKVWTIKATQQESIKAYLLYADILLSDQDVKENFNVALSIFKGLSSHGHATASRRLAKLYEQGISTNRDRSKAIEYYKLAVSQGHLESELNIGRLYTDGSATNTDLGKAESIFLRFAESGNPQAAYLLSKLYLRKSVIENKPLLEKSVEWLKISADKGFVPAKIRLINLHLAENPDNVEFAVIELTKLSVLNEGSASYQLGRLFNTKNLEANKEQALKYYHLAYQQGYELAAFRLAEYYYIHKKNEDDMVQVRHWKQKASQQKTDTAIFLQAEFMLTGSNGWQQNKDKAIEMYKGLSERGMRFSSRALARIFEAGIYTNKDLQQALFYFEMAASQGDVLSKLNAANYYANGIGVEQDWPRAEAVFLQYAKTRYHKAAYLLANNYEKQAILSGNKIPEQAVYWYQIAAKKKNTPARLKVAEMKLQGEGLPQDINKAIAELNLLSEQGIARASFRLGTFYSEILNENIDLALHFYQRAFIQGSPQSTFILAEKYRQGIGIKDQSIKETFVKLANTGNSDSAYLLGILDEVLLKPNSALIWYKKAANTGHAEAQLALVNQYQKAGNFEAANQWLLKAVQANNGTALLQYGEALFWGRKMKANKIQGLAYILSASRLHIKNAVSKSLIMMVNLNSVEKIERANQLSKEYDTRHFSF